METRANYVMIGAFTLAGALGLLLFFTWFARVELDRQFSYYDINFPTVTGLSNASDVRFSGFPVGQVVDVGLSPEGDGTVRVRIEVTADTPVRTGTVATIEAQGVTGVSYVGLAAGDPEEPLLADVSDDDIPTITAERSILQTLGEGAPELFDEVIEVTRSVGEILGEDNQLRITAILSNVETASVALDGALEDFSSVAETIAQSSTEIAEFTSRLENISAAAVQALETADGTLKSVTDVADRLEGSLDIANGTLAQGTETLEAAETYIRDHLSQLTTELQSTTIRLQDEIGRVGAETSAVLGDLRNIGGLAADRLAQVEATIDTFDLVLLDTSKAMEDVSDAAVEFDELLEGDASLMIAETRAAIADAGRIARAAADIAEADVPAIIQDLRTATSTTTQVVQTVGADLSRAVGRLDGVSEDVAATLASVSGTFEAANQTLGQINTALETGDKALKAAEQAFLSADTLLTEEVSEMTEVLRSALERIEAAIGEIIADIPEISEDLRTTASDASAAFAQIQQTTETVSPALNDFAVNGLGQVTRLAQESRTLVENFDRLIRAIERDPARYFFGRTDPEFRR